MHHIEIELRYEVLDKNQLTQFLAPLKFLRSNQDIDIYYDNADAILYQKGIFIRNRNNKKLDIKFNRACLDNPDLAIQDYCEEHSFALPLQEKNLSRINELLVSLQLQPSPIADLEELKKTNNFFEHYRVDKVRTSYSHNSFTIAVDEVVDLGTFLEIELMAQDTQNLEEVKQEMVLFIAGLKLRPLRTGYGTLLLRKKDFKHYLLGRFILEEDKVCRKTL
jgi:predicted adenylyl cyclase CyaB